MPAGLREDARDDLDCRALACAVRSEQSDDFAFAQTEGDGVKNLGAAVAEDQITDVDDRRIRGHASSPCPLCLCGKSMIVHHRDTESTERGTTWPAAVVRWNQQTGAGRFSS